MDDSVASQFICDERITTFVASQPVCDVIVGNKPRHYEKLRSSSRRNLKRVGGYRTRRYGRSNIPSRRTLCATMSSDTHMTARQCIKLQHEDHSTFRPLMPRSLLQGSLLLASGFHSPPCSMESKKRLNLSTCSLKLLKILPRFSTNG